MQSHKKPSIHSCSTKIRQALSQSMHMQNTGQEQLLAIDHNQLVFDQVQADKTYELQFSIRNNTSRLLKIKVYSPKSALFKLQGAPLSETLSAGLSKKITIAFRCKQPDNYYDSLKILCESTNNDIIDKTYTVQLKALQPNIKIQYNKIIEGGMIPMNTKNKFTVLFKNSRNLSKIKIIKDNHQTLFYSPDQFILQAYQQKIVTISITPTNPGVYRHRLLLQANGQIIQPINIVYTSTQFKFYVADQMGNKINQYDIGNTYHGHKKNVTLFYVNNTPEAVNVKSKIRLGWKFNQSALQSPQQLAMQCSSTIMNVQPNVIEIQAFSRKKIVLSCMSQATQQIQRKVSNFAKRDNQLDSIAMQISKIKLIDNQFHQTLIIEYLQKKIYCSLKATCVYPMIKITPIFLNFGEISLKQTVSAKLKVQNYKQLPISVLFPKAFAFEIFPHSLTLQAHQKIQIQVFLTPVSYGQFNTSIVCIISQSYRIQIPVSYSTKNTTKRQSISSHQESRRQPLAATNNLLSLGQSLQKKLKHRQKNFYQSLHKTDKTKKLTKCKINLSSSALPNNNTRMDTFHELSLPNNKNTIFMTDQLPQKLISESKTEKIPKIKDPLFVTRKIDKYEPYNTSNLKIKNYSQVTTLGNNNTKKLMNSSANFKLSRTFMKKEQQVISQELPVQALKNIEVSEKVIHFGKVFIHSKIIKQFQIINNNDFNVQVKLTSFHQFLEETQDQPKILPPKTRAKFKIVLVAKQCGQFENLIQYTINTVHSFRFLVQAEVELVTLNVSKSNLKLIYQDDTKDMFLSDYFDLTNQGNTNAYFCIDQNNPTQHSFGIEPKQGSLEPGESVNITVKYNCEKKQTIQAGEPKNIKQFNKQTFLMIDQRLLVKVKNGLDMFVRVQSNAQESKCFVKESRINFGCCIVPKAKNKSFILRNLSRSLCLYEIDNSNCENLLTFQHTMGKVLPESSKQIMVTYQSNIIQELNMSFKVLIRGGLVINVPFNAQSIAPKIHIVEDVFNFGEICCGSTGMESITIKNQSETMVELLLDLVNEHSSGVEYLNVYFEHINKDEAMPLQTGQRVPAIHRLKIQSKSTYKFNLLFQPKIPGFYQFQLPLYIENLIKNQSIVRIVKCYAKQPKFFIEPSLIKFKKKIINEKDNACFHPLVQFITFKNPSQNLLKWKIDLPKTQRPQQKQKDKQVNNSKKLCFEIQTRKGQIKSKSWQCINIFFNPYQAGFYEYKFPLLIYNWEKGEYVQEAEIKVEGEGQYPILLFDRRELILPVVPLNVESVGMFKIINEGYETIDIKHNIETLDQIIPIPQIILFYPQGSKMGINKKQLYVIVKFSAKKPVSFTVKLEIDDGNRCYELPISGTADNSIFTVFPYLSDKQNLYKFESINEAIVLKNIDIRNIFDKLHNYYEQVTEADYVLPCEIIRRWINTFLKDDKVIRFPQDLVENNEIFLKFLAKLTNKKQLEKFPFPTASSPSQQLQNQQNFYEYIIRILKSMGCLLNHIRPYYLLNKNQFMQIFQQNQLKHMTETYRKYSVIHLDSWIIVFYQLINNFWYNPQRLKAMHSEGGIKSNIYSTMEISVLKWIKQIYQQYNENDEHKFLDFNKDFKDSLGPIYALYHYNFFNKSQPLEGLNKHIISNSDYCINTRVLYTMLIKANLIPLISQDEYLNIKQKQMFLFLYQLYESLPQQVPKTAPIIFTCELGERCTKYIEIKNPSSKAVSYWLKIEGSPDYYPEDKQAIKIQPKSSYKLGIEFRSRVSKQQVAYLMLFNKKQSDSTTNTGIGCSLVFELRSHIVGRKSIKKLDNLRCQMYQSMSIKIPVENAFNDKQYGNFKINISEQVYETKQPIKIFNFFVEVESLKIRRNTSSFLELTYNPLVMKPIRCYIIFCDQNVGEFQYEIIGIPQVPKPLQQLKISNPIYINNHQSIDLSLPVYNNYLMKSLSVIQQKLEFLKSSGRASKSSQLMMFLNNSHLHEQQKQNTVFNVQINMDPKILNFIKFPSQLIIFHQRNKKNRNDVRNKLKIQCNFNMIIKELVLDFVLVSHDKRDIRRFRAQLNVTSQPVVNNLLMKTNARTSLTQEIPIENTTNKDWKISLAISEFQLPHFSLKTSEMCLNRQIICKKNSKAEAHIIYNPMQVSESGCKLTITNQITSEQIIYMIKSISEQPLSEDHLYFSTFTGKSNLHKIQIKNPYPQAVVYYVQTDLPQLDCRSEINMQSQQKCQFSMIITANNPGIFIGFLKFIDIEQNRYFWYSVTIQAEDQIVFEDSIKLETLLDKEIEKVLEFKNSLSKSVTYRVDYEDYHGVYGEKIFDVKPYSNYLYRLKYKPTQVRNEEGIIRIFCPQKGAHIYKLVMISHEHFKRQLQPLKVEVGRTGVRQIKLTDLQNTKNKKLNIISDISNPNFSVQNDSISSDDGIVRVVYKPVQEGLENCTIKVIYGHNLTKLFEIQGLGIAPFTVETIQFSSINCRPVLQIIKFKNPYQSIHLNSKNSDKSTERIDKFQISIESNALKLFRFVDEPENWDISLKASEIVAIPIQFKPVSQGYFESMLTIQADNYKWQYLLKGSCYNQLFNTNHYDEQIQTKTREEGIKILTVELPEFFRQQNLWPNRVQITHIDDTMTKILRKWLNIRIQSKQTIQYKSKYKIQKEQLATKVSLYMRFRPNKPLSQIITLSLFSDTQSSLKITKKIKLISQPPEPEQKINIQINFIKKHIFLLPIQIPNTSLQNCISKLQKGLYFQAAIVDNSIQVKFIPNNCTFKNNTCSDLLIVQSPHQYRSYEIIIVLKNKEHHKGLKN